MVEPGRQHCQADPRGIRAASHPPQVPPLPGKARPASWPRMWGHLTNNKASMPNSIYPGAETCLIIDRDNDSIKGIYVHHPWSPPTLGHDSLVKNHILRVKIHEQVRRKLISSQASNAKGRVLAMRHRPRQGKIRLTKASIPPTRELQVSVGGKPAWLHRPP
jgi:hypothetical protein